MNPYILGGGASAAAACATGTMDSQSHNVGGTSTATGTLRGQSFKLSATGYIYSIQLRFYNIGGTKSDDYVLCLDNAANMGSSGTCSDAIVCASKTVSFGASGSEWHEFVFQDTTHQFLADTTYYMALRATDTQELGWVTTTDSSYAHGTEYSTTATDCDLTGHDDSGVDCVFRVYLCD